MSVADSQLDAWFAEAAELALRGRGLVEPNPMVGALALDGDRIVGRGWHAQLGGAHAEEVALQDARAQGARPDGLVVTLEPCSTEPGATPGREKRRPACTGLIREAQLQRVFVGAPDPDPRHGGAGVRILEDAGITVSGPHDSPRLQALLRQFRKHIGRDRPWVQTKWAMTLDGKIASRTGSSRWISGPEALRHAHVLRAAADGVMVGMGTVLADDPSLDVRQIDGPDPVALVVDPRAEIPLSSRLVARAANSPAWLLVSEDCPAANRRALEQRGLKLIDAPLIEGELDLRSAFVTLRGLGIRRLLVEGGGKLVGLLFDLGLVDQVEAILAPKLIGGRAAPGPIAGLGKELMEEAVPLQDHYTAVLGDCLLFGGYPLNPDPQG